MTKLAQASPEQLADAFVSYLTTKYGGTRHVRRVASWIGFIVLGIHRLSKGTWKVPRTRQLRFEYRGHAYKARYSHTIKPRGGIEIVGVSPGRGAPDGKLILTIGSLQDAEAFYQDPKSFFP